MRRRQRRGEPLSDTLAIVINARSQPIRSAMDQQGCDMDLLTLIGLKSVSIRGKQRRPVLEHARRVLERVFSAGSSRLLRQP